MRQIIAGACSLMLLSAAIAGQQQPASSEAARFGDRVFTIQELDRAWQAFDAVDHAKANQAIYEGRKQALDRLVADALIKSAAAAKGLTPDKFVEGELERRTKPVTAAQVEEFYNANKQQMQGKTLPELQDLIRDFLEQEQRREARETLIAELRKTGPALRMLIDAPRETVSIGSSDPVRGASTAAVTVIEFSDYQCPFCGRVTPTLKRLRETYGDRLRIVWKDFPLEDIHPLAAKAAEAAHCAGEQGKYWEFHDRLFANQSALATDALKQHATAVGLEATGFTACLDSGRYAKRVREGIDAGKALSVDSTPTVFVNGRRVTGAQPYSTFADMIDEELARAAVKP